MYQQLPDELNCLIFAYANMRYHAGKISNKFHPNDARIALVQAQLEKNRNVRKDSYEKIHIVLQVTRFKYVSMKKIIDSLGPDTETSGNNISYHISTIFTYKDDIHTTDQLYIFSNEILKQT